jgi:hypothetical protein
VALFVKYGISLICGAALCCELAGCTGPLVYRPKKPEVKATPAASAAAAQSALLPQAPDPKANNATLAGIDSKGVGVRDDVQLWIYANYTSAKKRTPLMALARELQLVLAKTPKTHADAQKLQNSFDDALLTLRRVPGLRSDEAEEMNSSLYVQIFNTPKRRTIYLEYNLLLLDGKGARAPEGGTLRTVRKPA